MIDLINKCFVNSLEKPPWDVKRFPCNVLTNEYYDGINALLLNIRAGNSFYWGSKEDWNSLNYEIKANEKGIQIYDLYPSKEVLYYRNGKKTIDEFEICVREEVFNIDQVEGNGSFICRNEMFDCIGVANSIIRNSEMEVCEGNANFYNREGDFITIMPTGEFLGDGDYEITLLHELAHFAEKRVYWCGTVAMSELVAEMAAYEIKSRLGSIRECADISQFEKYQKVWMELPSKNKHAVIKCAEYSSKIANFLIGLYFKNITPTFSMER